MPESRDRLSREDDAIIASYSRSRASRTGDGSAGRGIAIAFVLVDDSEEGQTARTPFRWRDTAMTGSPRSIRGGIGTPRIRGNSSPVVESGRGRGRGGVFPTWYPRRPLNDITAVVRAMERRREIGGGECKRCPPSIGRVPKILLDITHQNSVAADCLTPQKKLMNSIDTVEKVVMDELRKLKMTPSAKKAEREKRVRTLMSMR